MPERSLTAEEKFGEAMNMIDSYWRMDARQRGVEKIGVKFIEYAEGLDCVYLKLLINHAIDGGLGRGRNTYFLNMLNPIYRDKRCNEGR